jgi:hypothetical protein
MKELTFSNHDRKGCVLSINNNYDNVSFISETIDKIVFKTIVLRIQGYFIVTSDTKPTRVINKLSDMIKLNTIKHFNQYYFKDIIIDIVDTPYTFNEKKTGFVSLDYTIFVNKGIKFDKQELTILMNELSKKIHEEYFENPMGFEVYKKRTDSLDRTLWNPDEYYPGDVVDVNERL